MEYEQLKSRTPIIQGFSQYKAKKESLKNRNSKVNHQWSGTKKSYHTLEKKIVKMIDKIDKWKYVIEKMK